MATTGIIKLEETCIMCPRRGSKVCPNCKNARYCSTGTSDRIHSQEPHTNQCADCQKVDWKLHKILCPTFNQEKPEITKHHAFHRRGLFFPGGDQKARFVWVEVWTEREGTWTVYDQFEHSVYFGGETSSHYNFSDPNPIQAREIMRDDTEFGLHCWTKDLNVREPPNFGLRSCTRGQACAPNFRGPILVMRKVDFGQGKEKYVDIDMRDARSAADFFSSDYRDGSRKMVHLKDQRVLVSSCRSPEHMAQNNTTVKYSEHVLDGCDSIFWSGGSGIANLLGFPLSLRLAKTQQTGHHNTEAMLLMRDITSTIFGPPPFADRYINRDFHGENGFGSSGYPWGEDVVGPVFAARSDGLPLLKEHLEALCKYIESRVEPKLVAAISGLSPGDVVPDREAILNAITKADFLDFFDAMKVERGATDAGWLDLPSPYEVTRAGQADKIEKVWEVQGRVGFLQQSDRPRQRFFMIEP